MDTPNCTSPDKSVNFVESAEGRGTLDILWSSIFTVVACTWTILHLNVPEQRDGRDPGWKGDLKWGLRGVWAKLKWMVITTLAPEAIVCLSASNLAHSKSELSKLMEFAALDGVPWSLTHSALRTWEDLCYEEHRIEHFPCSIELPPYKRTLQVLL